MLVRSMQSSYPRIVTFAAWSVSLGVALALGACGQCLKLQSEWQDRLVLELVAVGAGSMPDSGASDHAQLILGPRMLSQMADAVGNATPLRAMRLQRRMGTLANDPVIVLQAGYALQHMLVETVDGRPMLRLTFALNGTVVVQRTLSDEMGELAGRVQVLAPLNLSSERGAVQMTLRMAGGTISEFDTTVELVDQTEANFALLLLREDLLGQLAQLTAELPIWSLEPTSIGRLPVRFTATRLTPLASGRAIEIGLVTNLRPRGELSTPLGAWETSADDVTWMVHPGLPEAAVHYAAANGVVERSFHAETPSLHQEVTVDYLHMVEDGFEYSVTRWCFSHAPCSATIEHGSGTLVGTRGGVLVTATGSGESASMEGRAFVDGMQQVVEQVLRTPEMRLAADQPITLRLQTVVTGPEGIRYVLEGLSETDSVPVE
jgi:hypothetical protein